MYLLLFVLALVYFKNLYFESVIWTFNVEFVSTLYFTIEVHCYKKIAY